MWLYSGPTNPDRMSPVELAKDKVAAAIKKFKTRAEAKSGKKLRVLRNDHGGEFTSVEFAAYCADQGVMRHHTAPYSPQ